MGEQPDYNETAVINVKETQFIYGDEIAASGLCNRKREQDAVYISDTFPVGVVSDGVSEYRESTHVSDIATRIIGHRNRATAPGTIMSQQIAEQTFSQEWDTVIQMLQESKLESGSAATAAFHIYEDNGQRKLTMIHAGDARVYAVDQSGSVVPLTHDHSIPGIIIGGEVLKNPLLSHLSGDQKSYVRLLAQDYYSFNIDTEQEPNPEARLREILDQRLAVYKKIFNFSLSTQDQDTLRTVLTTYKGKMKALLLKSLSLSEKMGDKPDIQTIPLPNTVIAVFACSDGMHGILTPSEIEKAVSAVNIRELKGQLRSIDAKKTVKALMEATITATNDYVDDISVAFHSLKPPAKKAV